MIPRINDKGPIMLQKIIRVWGKTEESVGKLFMAGVGPGIFMGALFLITAIIVARVKKFKSGTPMPWPDRIHALRRAIPGLFMPVLVLGGIYGGIFTPTEAAAVAVVYSSCWSDCLFIKTSPTGIFPRYLSALP